MMKLIIKYADVNIANINQKINRNRNNEDHIK